MSRKVEEAILASEMEHYYSKEEILTMYSTMPILAMGFGGLKMLLRSISVYPLVS